jgi:hypothetical protein
MHVSLFDVSLETANKFYTWGWRASVFGAVITAVSLAFLYLGTRIRDKDFELSIARANTDASSAISEAAKLSLRAAELEKGNIELRTKMASRRISEEQHKILVDELSKIPAPFDIALMSDPESVLYANDILKTFADAHWTVGQKEFPISEIWTGLVLFQTDDPAGGRILQALKKAGVTFTIGDDAHRRPKATIMVGNKPPQF